jgi:hypothetical protein
VLPLNAHPHGFTLDDVAAEVADFTINGNDPTLYPDTPFQIIYRGGSNTFIVGPGTPLYVSLSSLTIPILSSAISRRTRTTPWITSSGDLNSARMTLRSKWMEMSRPSIARGTSAGQFHALLPMEPATISFKSRHLLAPSKRVRTRSRCVGFLDGDAVLDLIGEAYVFSITYTVIVE